MANCDGVISFNDEFYKLSNVYHGKEQMEDVAQKLVDGVIVVDGDELKSNVNDTVYGAITTTGPSEEIELAATQVILAPKRKDSNKNKSKSDDTKSNKSDKDSVVSKSGSTKSDSEKRKERRTIEREEKKYPPNLEPRINGYLTNFENIVHAGDGKMFYLIREFRASDEKRNEVRQYLSTNKLLATSTSIILKSNKARVIAVKCDQGMTNDILESTNQGMRAFSKNDPWIQQQARKEKERKYSLIIPPRGVSFDAKRVNGLLTDLRGYYVYLRTVYCILRAHQRQGIEDYLDINLDNGSLTAKSTGIFRKSDGIQYATICTSDLAAEITKSLENGMILGSENGPWIEEYRRQHPLKKRKKKLKLSTIQENKEQKGDESQPNVPTTGKKKKKRAKRENDSESSSESQSGTSNVSHPTPKQVSVEKNDDDMKQADIGDAQLQQENTRGGQPTTVSINASKPPTDTEGLKLDDNFGIEDVDDENQDQNGNDDNQIPRNVSGSQVPPRNNDNNNNQSNISLTQSQITNVNIKNRKTNVNPNQQDRSFYGFSNSSNRNRDGSVKTSLRGIDNENSNDNNQQRGGFWPFVKETEEERRERLHERNERLKAQKDLKDDIEWQIANAIVYNGAVYKPIITGLPVEEIRELAKSWKLREDQDQDLLLTEKSHEQGSIVVGGQFDTELQYLQARYRHEVINDDDMKMLYRLTQQESLKEKLRLENKWKNKTNILKQQLRQQQQHDVQFNMHGQQEDVGEEIDRRQGHQRKQHHGQQHHQQQQQSLGLQQDEIEMEEPSNTPMRTTPPRNGQTQVRKSTIYEKSNSRYLNQHRLRAQRMSRSVYMAKKRDGLDTIEEPTKKRQRTSETGQSSFQQGRHPPQDVFDHLPQSPIAQSKSTLNETFDSMFNELNLQFNQQQMKHMKDTISNYFKPKASKTAHRAPITTFGKETGSNVLNESRKSKGAASKRTAAGHPDSDGNPSESDLDSDASDFGDHGGSGGNGGRDRRDRHGRGKKRGDNANDSDSDKDDKKKRIGEDFFKWMKRMMNFRRKYKEVDPLEDAMDPNSKHAQKRMWDSRMKYDIKPFRGIVKGGKDYKQFLVEWLDDTIDWVERTRMIDKNQQLLISTIVTEGLKDDAKEKYKEHTKYHGEFLTLDTFIDWIMAEYPLKRAIKIYYKRCKTCRLDFSQPNHSILKPYYKARSMHGVAIRYASTRRRRNYSISEERHAAFAFKRLPKALQARVMDYGRYKDLHRIPRTIDALQERLEQMYEDDEDDADLLEDPKDLDSDDDNDYKNKQRLQGQQVNAMQGGWNGYNSRGRGQGRYGRYRGGARYRGNRGRRRYNYNRNGNYNNNNRFNYQTRSRGGNRGSRSRGYGSGYRGNNRGQRGRGRGYVPRGRGRGAYRGNRGRRNNNNYNNNNNNNNNKNVNNNTNNNNNNNGNSNYTNDGRYHPIFNNWISPRAPIAAKIKFYVIAGNCNKCGMQGHRECHCAELSNKFKKTLKNNSIKLFKTNVFTTQNGGNEKNNQSTKPNFNNNNNNETKYVKVKQEAKQNANTRTPKSGRNGKNGKQNPRRKKQKHRMANMASMTIDNEENLNDFSDIENLSEETISDEQFESHIGDTNADAEQFGYFDEEGDEYQELPQYCNNIATMVVK